jgi:hypothetical protein
MTHKASHSASPVTPPDRQEAPQTGFQPGQQADKLTRSTLARAALDAGLAVPAGHGQG